MSSRQPVREDELLKDAFDMNARVSSAKAELQDSLQALKRCNSTVVSESEKLARVARDSRTMQAVKPPQAQTKPDDELTGKFNAIRSAV